MSRLHESSSVAESLLKDEIAFDMQYAERIKPALTVSVTSLHEQIQHLKTTFNVLEEWLKNRSNVLSAQEEN